MPIPITFPKWKAKANLCLGDRVEILSTGVIADRAYIGQVGKLLEVHRTPDHRVIAWLVDMGDKTVRASDVQSAE